MSRMAKGLFIAILVVLLYEVYLLRFTIWSSPNALLLGDDAVGPGLVDIPVVDPVEFDGATRERICHLRRLAVTRHADALTRSYTPYVAVFGQVVDGKPWWGMTGHFVHGKGARSHEGPSEEARFVLNPYLLVAVEFYGLSRWSGLRWTKDAQLEPTRLPLVPKVGELRIWPRERRGEVTYYLSDFLKALRGKTVETMTLADTSAGLIAYNARDFGLAHLAIDLGQSTNVTQAAHTGEAHFIRHYIHLGRSCGLPGGGNNMSPSTPEFDGLSVETLPARLCLRLWRDAPPSSSSSPAAADMTFIVRFE